MATDRELLEGLGLVAPSRSQDQVDADKRMLETLQRFDDRAWVTPNGRWKVIDGDTIEDLWNPHLAPFRLAGMGGAGFDSPETAHHHYGKHVDEPGGRYARQYLFDLLSQNEGKVNYQVIGKDRVGTRELVDLYINGESWAQHAVRHQLGQRVGQFGDRDYLKHAEHYAATHLPPGGVNSNASSDDIHYNIDKDMDDTVHGGNTFGRAWQRGKDQSAAAYYQALNALGRVTAELTGNDDYRRWGQEGIARNLDRVLRNPPKIDGWEDINTYADIGTLLVEGLGENAYQWMLDAGLALGTGGVSAAGRAIIAKGVEQQIGKAAFAEVKRKAMAAGPLSAAGNAAMNKAGQKAAADAVLQKQLSHPAVRASLEKSGAVGPLTQEATEAARQMALRAPGARAFSRGASAAAAGSMYAQAVGEVDQELLGQNIDSPASAFAAGVPVAALDLFALEKTILEPFFKKARKTVLEASAKEGKDRIKFLAKEAAKEAAERGVVGMTAEAITEAMQEMIGKFTAQLHGGEDAFSDEAWQHYAFIAAKAGPVGGTMSTASSLLGSLKGRTPKGYQTASDRAHRAAADLGSADEDNFDSPNRRPPDDSGGGGQTFNPEPAAHLDATFKALVDGRERGMFLSADESGDTKNRFVEQADKAGLTYLMEDGDLVIMLPELRDQYVQIRDAHGKETARAWLKDHSFSMDELAGGRPGDMVSVEKVDANGVPYSQEVAPAEHAGGVVQKRGAEPAEGEQVRVQPMLKSLEERQVRLAEEKQRENEQLRFQLDQQSGMPLRPDGSGEAFTSIAEAEAYLQEFIAATDLLENALFNPESLRLWAEENSVREDDAFELLKSGLRVNKPFIYELRSFLDTDFAQVRRREERHRAAKARLKNDMLPYEASGIQFRKDGKPYASERAARAQATVKKKKTGVDYDVVPVGGGFGLVRIDQQNKAVIGKRSNLHEERLLLPEGERIEGHTGHLEKHPVTGATEVPQHPNKLEWGRAEYEDPDLLALPDGTSYPARPSNATAQARIKNTRFDQPLTEHQVDQLNNLDYPYTVENLGDGYGIREQQGPPTRRKGFIEAKSEPGVYEGDTSAAERDRGDAGERATETDAGGIPAQGSRIPSLTAREYFGHIYREQTRDGLSNEAFAERKVRDVAREGLDIFALKAVFRASDLQKVTPNLSEAYALYVHQQGSGYTEEQALSFAADFLQNAADASRDLTQQPVVDNTLAEESVSGQVDHARDQDLDELNYTGEYDDGLTVGEEGNTRRDDEFKVHISQFRDYRHRPTLAGELKKIHETFPMHKAEIKATKGYPRTWYPAPAHEGQSYEGKRVFRSPDHAWAHHKRMKNAGLVESDTVYDVKDHGDGKFTLEQYDRPDQITEQPKLKKPFLGTLNPDRAITLGIKKAYDRAGVARRTIRKSLDYYNVHRGASKLRLPGQPLLAVQHTRGLHTNLSNIAFRPFYYRHPAINHPRAYLSVEHAYQTLKSGQFDPQIYGEYFKALAEQAQKKGGVSREALQAEFKANYKSREPAFTLFAQAVEKGATMPMMEGYRQANQKTRILLMEDLVEKSFDVNPEARKALLDTKYAQFSHPVNDELWSKEFPRILEYTRHKLRKKYEERKLLRYESVDKKTGIIGETKFPPHLRLPDLTSLGRAIHHDQDNRAKIDHYTSAFFSMLGEALLRSDVVLDSQPPPFINRGEHTGTARPRQAHQVFRGLNKDSIIAVEQGREYTLGDYLEFHTLVQQVPTLIRDYHKRALQLLAEDKFFGLSYKEIAREAKRRTLKQLREMIRFFEQKPAFQEVRSGDPSFAEKADAGRHLVRTLYRMKLASDKLVYPADLIANLQAEQGRLLDAPLVGSELGLEGVRDHVANQDRIHRLKILLRQANPAKVSDYEQLADALQRAEHVDRNMPELLQPHVERFLDIDNQINRMQAAYNSVVNDFVKNMRKYVLNSAFYKKTLLDEKKKVFLELFDEVTHRAEVFSDSEYHLYPDFVADDPQLQKIRRQLGKVMDHAELSDVLKRHNRIGNQSVTRPSQAVKKLEHQSSGFKVRKSDKQIGYRPGAADKYEDFRLGDDPQIEKLEFQRVEIGHGETAKENAESRRFDEFGTSLQTAPEIKPKDAEKYQTRTAGGPIPAGAGFTRLPDSLPVNPLTGKLNTFERSTLDKQLPVAKGRVPDSTVKVFGFDRQAGRIQTFIKAIHNTLGSAHPVYVVTPSAADKIKNADVQAAIAGVKSGSKDGAHVAMYDSKKEPYSVIVLRDGLNAAETFFTLAHELGHAMQHTLIANLNDAQLAGLDQAWQQARQQDNTLRFYEWLADKVAGELYDQVVLEDKPDFRVNARGVAGQTHKSEVTGVIGKLAAGLRKVYRKAAEILKKRFAPDKDVSRILHELIAARVFQGRWHFGPDQRIDFSDSTKQQARPLLAKMKGLGRQAVAGKDLLYKMGTFMYTVDRQTRALGINAGRLMDHWHSDPHETRETHNLLSGEKMDGDFFTVTANDRGRYLHELSNVTVDDVRFGDMFGKQGKFLDRWSPYEKPLDQYKADIEQGTKELHGEVDNPKTLFARMVRQFLKSFYMGYLKQRLPTVGFLHNYFPFTFDIDQLVQNRQKAIALITRFRKDHLSKQIALKYNHKFKKPFLSERDQQRLERQYQKALATAMSGVEEEVRQMVDRIINGHGTLELAIALEDSTLGPGFSARQAREYFAIEGLKEALTTANLMERDAMKVLYNYITHSTKRANFEKHFGGYKLLDGALLSHESEGPLTAKVLAGLREGRDQLLMQYAFNVARLPVEKDKNSGITFKEAVDIRFRIERLLDKVKPTEKDREAANFLFNQLARWEETLSLSQYSSWYDLMGMIGEHRYESRFFDTLAEVLTEQGFIKKGDEGELQVYSPTEALNMHFASIYNESGEQAMKAAQGNVRAMLGQIGSDMPRDVQAAMSTMMAYQSTTVLLFSTLSSFVEPFGAVFRNRDAAGMWSSLKQIGSLVGSAVSNDALWKELKAQTQAAGIIGQRMTQDVLQQTIGTTYQSKKAQKILDHLFYFNGQEWFTDVTRTLSYGIAKHSIERWVNLAEKGDARAIQYLKDIGLDAGIYRQWDGERPTLAMEQDLARDPDNQALRDQYDIRRKVHLAHVKFVDESAVRPNAAQRPRWGSDPRFMLLWHLKQFFYSYGKMIILPFLNHMKAQIAAAGRGKKGIERISLYGKEVAVQALPLMLAGVMLMGLSAFGWELREALQYRLFGKPTRSSKMKDGEYYLELLSRAGVWGPYDYATSLFDSKGGADARFAYMAGPTTDWLYNWLNPDSSFSHKVFRSIPILNQLPGAKERLKEAAH